jgi:hypothetical protein
VKYRYLPSAKVDLPKAKMLDSLMFGVGSAKIFSLAQFDALAHGKAMPTGGLVYEVDRGFPLILNDYAETSFLRFVCSSGYAQSIRGQTVAIPYRKPWASTPSPYYPDFLLYTYDGHIAIVEVKSILGMCQDENIAKFEYLLSFCKRQGYLCAFLDAERVSIRDYWSEPLLGEEAVVSFFEKTVASQGGFNDANLKVLEKAFPKRKPATLKRTVASLILRDPTLSNRYCHDSPYLLNAVKVPSPLAFKLFS